MKTFLLMLFLFSASTIVCAQDIHPDHRPGENDVIPRSENPRDGNFEREINEGVSLMNKGAFKEADAEFRAVLASVKTVPADLCFYFGKNSYHLKKYRQSIDWLTKYIELKGSYGKFYDQATEYVELARADFKVASADTATGKSANTNTNAASKKEAELDCAVHPYVTCPVCHGDGVIIQRGQLGASIYKTCPYSDEYGRMTCEDYKLYVKGQLIK